MNSKKEQEKELSHEEGNKLIADFMHNPNLSMNFPTLKDFYGSDGLRYHKDWNWLMPVIGKLAKKNSVRFVLSIGADTDIKSTWEYIVKQLQSCEQRNNPDRFDYPTPEESPYLYKRKEKML